MKTLSRAELWVMVGLWQCGRPATRREIALQLPPQAKEAQWAGPTVLNFLIRLEQKGFVRAEKQGNRNVYTPLVRRATYSAAAAAEMAELLCDGDWRCVMRDLADAGRVSNGELEQLARWLDTRVVEHPEYDYE